MKITIIGAGVAGLTCAAELNTQGHDIEVIALSQTIGEDACSWFAGGMLAPWCEGESAPEQVVRLGQQALDWWDTHVSGVERCGTLVLSHSRDASELRRFSRRTSHHELIDALRIEQLEPDLGNRFTKALFFAQEGHLNPRCALPELADNLHRKGVRFLLGTNADTIKIDSDLTIDCRGLRARENLKNLRAVTGLRGVKGEMLIIRSRDINLSRPVRLLHPRIPLYIVPRGDGVHMIGATMLEADASPHISLRSTLELLGAAYALHPGFAESEVLETGVDARPAFNDNLPKICREGAKLYVNGLYRHGFLMSPALAKMVREAVENPQTVPELME